jgi:hypothetical protein
VLCLRSEFFRALLLGEFFWESEIELEEFSEETMLGVLRYLYCDDESCLEGRLGEVTSLAQFFGVSDLVVKCQSQLTRSVAPDNFGSLYSLGLMLNLTYLLEFAKDLYAHIHQQLIAYASVVSSPWSEAAAQSHSAEVEQLRTESLSELTVLLHYCIPSFSLIPK